MTDPYRKVWESIGKALSTQSKMILWIAERTLSAKEYNEFVNEFAKNQKIIMTNCLISHSRKVGESGMTNREAVDAIKMAIAQVEWDYPMNYAAAFDKAIEALEQPEIVRCKECKYRNDPHNCGIAYEGCTTSDDWFCPDGERSDKS